MDPLTSFLLSLTSGLLIAIATAIITVRLSLQRFRSERWCERKADAYSKTIEALYSLYQYFVDMEDDEIFDRQVSLDEFERQKQRVKKTNAELTRISTIGEFSVSKITIQALATLQKELRDICNDSE